MVSSSIKRKNQSLRKFWKGWEVKAIVMRIIQKFNKIQNLSLQDLSAAERANPKPLLKVPDKVIISLQSRVFLKVQSRPRRNYSSKKTHLKKKTALFKRKLQRKART